MPREFEDKVVLVTGASSGIGEATAIAFAREGARVALSGRNEKRLEAAKHKCTEADGGKNPNKFLTVAGDLTNKANLDKLVTTTVDTFGNLDIVVAGHGTSSDFTLIKNVTEDDFDNMMATNVKSVYFLLQRVTPHLEKTTGCILIVSSVNSTQCGIGYTSFMAGKAGIDHMSRCVAAELAKKGIRVNAINPGIVDPGTSSDPELYSTLGEFHPLGRCSTLQEQVNTILFLTSDKASFTTGCCYKVDGGISLTVGNYDYENETE